jgi:hypothetical protein
MTPMREAFVSVLALIEQDDPLHDKIEINRLLILLMDRARDPEEAGAVAIYAAAVLRYLQACEMGGDEDIEQRLAEMEIQSQVLTAVMLLRRGTVKTEPQEVPFGPAFLDLPDRPIIASSTPL